MRKAVAAALGTLCALVALCPADRPDAAASTEAAAPTTPSASGDSLGIRATLQRSRLFEMQRGVRVNLRNEGAEDVRVEAVQLDSPWFETVMPEPRDPVLRAGDSPVGMPVPFGDARCDGDTGDPTLVVLTIGGEDVAVTAEERPAGLLAGLHDAECDVAAVWEQVDLRLGDRWTRTGPRTVVGAIEVSLLDPAATVAVLGVEGNVIFDLDLDEDLDATTDATIDAAERSDPLVEIDDDRPSGSIAVGLTASRCDPHALIEYKRTFTFVALVDTGGDEPVRVDVTAEGAAQEALQASLTACIG